MASFGEFLKQSRKKGGHTQDYLARALDVSTTYIHQMETGKIDAPGFERCRQLALALKLDVMELWDLARRERLAKYAERAGVTLDELFSELGSEVDGVSLCGSEQSLIRLFRKLDATTRKDFNGLVAMLFRHFPEDVQQELQKFLQSA